MPKSRVFSEIQLANGSTGDPVLYVDYPGRNNAIMFDAGDLANLSDEQLKDLEAVFITHHHVDHFMGLDRIVRANIDGDKTLSLFGPPGTIRKVYDRIKSYEYQYFPFQKIVIRVTDVGETQLDWALLECTRRFPEPKIQSQEWQGEPIFENEECVVTAGHVDHTVECLAYQFQENPGYHFDHRQLNKGLLKPGPWIDKVAASLNGDTSVGAKIKIDDGEFPVAQLAQKYFRRSQGAKVCYITDTIWSPKSEPVLRRLADKADQLYCDSFYSKKHRKQADKHRHMTATDTANLAAQAGVRELILIHFSQRYRGSYHMLVDEACEIFPKTSAEIL